MQNTISYVLWLPLMLFFCLLIPDFIIYGNIAIKAHQVAKNVVEVAEKGGGFDYSEDGVTVDLKPFIEDELRRRNLDPNHWEITYTEGKVDYNQPLTITLKGQYTFKAFSMIFSDDDAPFRTLPIHATKTGLGQVFFR